MSCSVRFGFSGPVRSRVGWVADLPIDAGCVLTAIASRRLSGARWASGQSRNPSAVEGVCPRCWRGYDVDAVYHQRITAVDARMSGRWRECAGNRVVEKTGALSQSRWPK